MLVASLAIFTIPVMAPAIARSLDVSPSLLGAWSALLWGSSLFTVFTAGHFISRHGALRASQACLVFCMGGLACAASGWLPGLGLAAILIGLGQGLETPASSALLARLTPLNRQALLFSIKQTGVQVAGMLAGIVFPLLLLATSWQGALIMTLALTAAMVLTVERLRGELEPPQSVRTGGLTMLAAMRHVRGDPRLVRLTFASFAYIAMQVCANTFLVTWAVTELGASLLVAGQAFAAMQIGGFLGRIAWGLVCGPRLRAHNVLIGLGAGMALCAVGLHLLTPQSSPALLAALSLATGLTVAGWNGLFLAEVARLSPPGEVGRVTSASFLFGSAGLVLGPVIFSVVAAASSYATAMLMMGCIAALGMIALLTGRSEPQGRPL
jgi:MFS family permease